MKSLYFTLILSPVCPQSPTGWSPSTTSELKEIPFFTAASSSFVKSAKHRLKRKENVSDMFWSSKAAAPGGPGFPVLLAGGDFASDSDAESGYACAAGSAGRQCWSSWCQVDVKLTWSRKPWGSITNEGDGALYPPTNYVHMYNIV